MIRIRVARLLAAIAIPCGYAPSASAFPLIRFWPDGDYPCDTTLQACIDGAGPNDEIRIATSGLIQESITFSKPLTLRAQPGFQPVLGLNHSIHASTSATGDQTIHIEGVTLEQGSIQVEQTSTGTSTIEIVGNTIEAKDPALLAAIDIVPNSVGLGPLVFLVSGNVVITQGGSGEGIRLRLGNGPSANGTVRDNLVTLQGGGTDLGDGGIVVYDATSVDVVANRISGGGGILFFTEGTMAARALDNLVTGQFNAIDATAESGGALELTIVNNTLANNQTGIFIGESEISPVTGVIANNAITGSHVAGLDIEETQPGLVSVSEHHDLFFGNTADSVPRGTGPNAVLANPLYASESDLHLGPGSPAIGAGDDASVPGDLATDLAGNPRIQGSYVDIGAYEAPEPSTTLSAMADIAVLVALGLRRRRIAADQPSANPS